MLVYRLEKQNKHNQKDQAGGHNDLAPYNCNLGSANVASQCSAIENAREQIENVHSINNGSLLFTNMREFAGVWNQMV